MNMGTRFIATKDAPVHQNVKEAIVNASELDTRLIMRSLTNTERVLNNPAVESLMAKEKALGDDLTSEDIVDEVFESAVEQEHGHAGKPSSRGGMKRSCQP